MKKLLITFGVIFTLVIAIMQPASNVQAAEQVATGVYSSEAYYSLPQFQKLSTSDKVKVLTTPGTVVALGPVVYKAMDVLTASDSELPTLAINVGEYKTEDGNTLVSGEKLDSKPVEEDNGFYIESIL